VLEVKPTFQQDPLDLRDIYIRSSGGSSTGSSGLVSGGSTAPAGFGPSSASVAAGAAGNASVSGGSSSSSPFSGAKSASSQVFNASGGQVPLSAFTHAEIGVAPITVNHQGQFPVVTLSFNLAPDASLGNAVDAVTRAKDDLHMPAS